MAISIMAIIVPRDQLGDYHLGRAGGCDQDLFHDAQFALADNRHGGVCHDDVLHEHAYQAGQDKDQVVHIRVVEHAAAGDNGQFVLPAGLHAASPADRRNIFARARWRH